MGQDGWRFVCAGVAVPSEHQIVGAGAIVAERADLVCRYMGGMGDPSSHQRRLVRDYNRYTRVHVATDNPDVGDRRRT